MNHILQELTYLSKGLQKHNTSPVTADHLFKNTDKRIFEKMKNEYGNMEKLMLEITTTGLFKNIQFQETNSANRRALPRRQLYQSVIDSMWRPDWWALSIHASQLLQMPPQH